MTGIIILILFRIVLTKAQNNFSFCEELTFAFQQNLFKFEGNNSSRLKGLSFCDLYVVGFFFNMVN